MPREVEIAAAMASAEVCTSSASNAGLADGRDKAKPHPMELPARSTID